jgi:peptidoglycan-associated lipoprotein
MMKRYTWTILATILCLSVVAFAGCRRSKPPGPPLPPLSQTPKTQVGAEETTDRVKPTGKGGLGDDGRLVTVYFDFDRSNIRPDQTDSVEKNAKYLLDHPDQKVLIEGHCDERGTNEYNFALGERRANACSTFLISRGVPAKNVSVVSKGEEEPATPGSNEAAWAKNRRAEFLLAE